MPYRVEKRGSKWVTFNPESGKVYGSHATEGEAQAQQRALYANAPPAKEKADSALHFDAGELGEPEETPEGFLRVPARLARTGVLTYRNPDGSLRFELVTPEVLFEADSLASHRLRPVLDDHPWSLTPPLVTADNAREYQRGSIGETVRRKGDFVEAPLMITDSELIGKIKAGMREVSLGYEAPTVQEEGTWNGQPYTHRQLSRRVNHCAIVPHARGGDDVRIRMDAAEKGVSLALGLAENGSVIGGGRTDGGTSTAETPTMKTKINGVTYEVADQVGEAIEAERQAHADALEAHADSKAKCDKCDAAMECPKCGKAKADAAAELERVKTDSKAQVDTLQAKLDAEKARADAAVQALTDAKKAHADASDPAKLRTQIVARLALEEKAKPFLAKEFKADSASDLEIKKAVLGVLVPELKLDGKSDSYVEARFDAEMERVQDGAAGQARARELSAARADGEGTRVDSRSAWDKMRERNASAWKMDGKGKDEDDGEKK